VAAIQSPARERLDLDLWFSSYVQTYLETGPCRDPAAGGESGDVLSIPGPRSDAHGEPAQSSGNSVARPEYLLRRPGSAVDPEAGQVVIPAAALSSQSRKRIRKSPKLYLPIPRLPGSSGVAHAAGHSPGPSFGALVETAVVAEWWQTIATSVCARSCSTGDRAGHRSGHRLGVRR